MFYLRNVLISEIGPISEKDLLCTCFHCCDHLMCMHEQIIEERKYPEFRVCKPVQSADNEHICHRGYVVGAALYLYTGGAYCIPLWQVCSMVCRGWWPLGVLVITTTDQTLWFNPKDPVHFPFELIQTHKNLLLSKCTCTCRIHPCIYVITNMIQRITKYNRQPGCYSSCRFWYI